MAYFKRGNWGYNPYKKWSGSYSKKRYYKNGVKSTALRSIRAANTQNSTINFAFKVNYAFTAKYVASEEKGVAAINVYDVLMKSENFLNMRNMYDQVKVNGVQVRINVTDAATAISDVNAIKSINVVTAWDKSGLSVEDCELYDSEDTLISNLEFDTAKAATYFNKIGSKITGYGSVKKGLLNSYQKFTRYGSCYPNTSNEKGLYIPTRIFNLFDQQIDTVSTKHYIATDYSGGPVNDFLANPNPVIPFENVSIPWKPTLLVGVFKTSINQSTNVVTQYADCDSVVFNAEFTIPCTFKGLKGDK